MGVTSTYIGSGLVALAAVLLLGTTAIAPIDKVVFLDVGQGDAILLQQGTAQVLVDGGPGAKVIERLGEEMPTFDRTIEVLIATHPDQDHIEGLLHVIDRYNVELVILPHAATTSQLFQAFIARIVEKDIPYRFAWAGQSLQAGNIAIQILAPVDTAQARVVARAGVNNASIATRIDFHNMSFLLTGDAERIAEHILVQATNPELLNVDILKVGHHGSSTSTQHELLAASSPAATVISVGKNNRYNHPKSDVLERLGGLPLWRTDEDGSVHFIWNPQTGWLAPQT